MPGEYRGRQALKVVFGPMNTPQRFARSADGTAIAWYDFGGEGPDVLLGHATGFCARIWWPIVAELRAHLRCVAYDARGHGLSGRPSAASTSMPGSGFDWERFADDASAVVSAAGLHNPFGIGHSSGGATQLLLEERTAGTFRSLFLFEPVVFANDPPAGPMPDRDLAIRARRRRSSFASRSEALQTFTERGPFTRLDPETLELYVDHGFESADDGSIHLRCQPSDEAEIYVMATAHGGYVGLPNVRCPVVVGHGETSTSFTAADMRAVAERLPYGRVHEFTGLGHFGPLESPKTFASAVLDFFDVKR